MPFTKTKLWNSLTENLTEVGRVEAYSLLMLLTLEVLEKT